jgi:hypothetical protein
MSITTNTIATTNNGVITRVTVIQQHDYRTYYWGVLAILALAFFAWILRKIFWQPDSN